MAIKAFKPYPCPGKVVGLRNPVEGLRLMPTEELVTEETVS